MTKSIAVALILLLMISCAPKAVKKEPEPVKETVSPFPEAWVIKETVNLRQRGTLSSPVIGTLKDGDRVYLLENVNGWYRIKYGDNQTAWLRSDLVGPRSLSRTILAKAFVDSTLPNFNAEMYFDTQELYKVIYLVLPEYDYSSKAKAARKAREIGMAYQENVYPGDLEIRIMNPDDQSELFMKVELERIAIADIPVPILEYGRLHKLETPSSGEVKLWILVPDSLSADASLEMAREISSNYAYPFTKAEIFLIEDSPDGRAYITSEKQEDDLGAVVKLYYLEDKDGELYRFGDSGEFPSPYQ